MVESKASGKTLKLKGNIIFPAIAKVLGKLLITDPIAEPTLMFSLENAKLCIINQIKPGTRDIIKTKNLSIKAREVFRPILIK